MAGTSGTRGHRGVANHAQTRYSALVTEIQARQNVSTDDRLAREARAFERHRPQLLRRYAGQFVAMYGGRVADRDKDAEALAARLFARLGDVPFFIGRVEKQPSAYDLPSPELGD